MARWDGLYTPEILDRVRHMRAAGTSWKDCADQIFEDFGVAFSANALRCKLQTPTADAPPAVSIPEKVAQHNQRAEALDNKSQIRALVAALAEKDKEIEAALRISQTPQEYRITARKTKTVSTTQVIMWSDWHVEETVKGAGINYLNEFNEQIADARIQQCIVSTARLMEITAKDAPVDRVILHLGGDFITGNIHEEGNTWCAPIDAILWVQDRLAAGIRHLLDHTKASLLIVCNSGNHSRITPKTRWSGEQGFSLETMMYHALRHALKNERRVEWLIAEGYHAYVDLYGKTLRFHHGHAVKYGGGVGGIFIPAYKAISQWNKARRADLDCFCHFHQLKNGGNFIVNGSLIGYNNFAVAIKADFERPYQKFFMFTSTGEVCAEYPIFLDGGAK